MKAALVVLAAAVAAAAALPARAAVAWITGGSSNAEIQAMKHEARSYPLNLVFTAGRQSAYVGRVKVVIEDPAGRVLASTVSGPILLVRLPSGTYHISAESRGRTMDRTVQVEARGFRRVDFHWRIA